MTEIYYNMKRITFYSVLLVACFISCNSAENGKGEKGSLINYSAVTKNHKLLLNSFVVYEVTGVNTRFILKIFGSGRVELFTNGGYRFDGISNEIGYYGMTISSDKYLDLLRFFQENNFDDINSSEKFGPDDSVKAITLYDGVNTLKKEIVNRKNVNNPKFRLVEDRLRQIISEVTRHQESVITVKILSNSIGINNAASITFKIKFKCNGSSDCVFKNPSTINEYKINSFNSTAIYEMNNGEIKKCIFTDDNYFEPGRREEYIMLKPENSIDFTIRAKCNEFASNGVIDNVKYVYSSDVAVNEVGAKKVIFGSLSSDPFSVATVK